MEKSTKRLIAGTVSGIVLAAGLYSGFYWSAYRNFALGLDLRKSGIHYQVRGFKPFLDGVVIDKLNLENELQFTRVYFHGMPWQIAAGKPDYIYVQEIRISNETLFTKPIAWPFSRRFPLTVDNVVFSKNILGQNIEFSGKAKQNPETPLLVDFESLDKSLKLSGKGEIRLKKGMIENVDLEFDNLRAAMPLLQAKRSAGWLSYNYEDGWNVIGEIETGFLSLAGQELYDSTLKINGKAVQPDFSFGAKNRNSLAGWVFDKDGTNLAISFKDDKKIMPWSGFTADTLVRLSKIMPLFKTEEAPKKIEIAEVKKPEVKPEKKTEPKKKEEPKKQEAEKQPQPEAEQVLKLPEHEAESLKVEAVQLPQMSFHKLVEKSLFKGFFYNMPLVYVPHTCLNEAETGCWTARARGGSFYYNPDDTPSYLLRIKDYTQAQQLQHVLLRYTVDSISIEGRGNNVEAMNLSGKTVEGQAAYIELSVRDLE